MNIPPPVQAARRVADGVTVDLLADPELPFWNDHFPRIGILPGVVQLDWAVRLAREHQLASTPFRGLRALKFVNPILRGARLSLDLTPRDRGSLHFRYHGEARDYSTGRILFGPGDA